MARQESTGQGGTPQRATPLEDTPITQLKGVGARLAERLAHLSISQVQDLLFHLPLRYQDRTRVVPIGALRPGDAAVIEGTIQLTELAGSRRRMLVSRLADGTGAVTLRFFHFTAAQRASLGRGARLRCYGEVRAGLNGLELVHPEYRHLDARAPVAVEEHLTPIYPSTQGLQQTTWRRLTDQALALVDGEEQVLREWLSPEILRRYHLPALTQALRFVHRPPPDAPVALLESGRHPAQRRLAFEELLAHRLSLRRLREQTQRHRAPPLDGSGALTERLLRALPFELTGAQRRVYKEIAADLRRPLPMLRLLQGDVGSGKTVVAAMAVLQAVEAGYQAAVMAPTEVLAEQHLRSFSRWLDPLGLQVAWLSGSVTGKSRAGILEAIAAGQVQVAVGTHALFQKSVGFARLGLVVVDEQHRFGVHQRLALREKGETAGERPHQLIMTATPIPRTLAMTAYADLDQSVIDAMPPGRTPVCTVIIPDARREEVIARVREACAAGRQAYWVCSLIEESEALQCEAAEATAELLAGTLPGLRVGLVHGRMRAQDKESAMGAFQRRELELLVATTVIEVGVDVPNASLMIIENAERFGLAQLHQLRGRVGRGGAESHCVLMYHGHLSELARARLRAVKDTNDGFAIAQKDLELRGPGEVLGTRQTGLLRLRVADVLRDQDLLPWVDEAAHHMLAAYPERIAPLARRWLGGGERYADA